MALRPNAGHGLLILEVSRSHTTTHHSGRTPLDEWWARRRDLYLTTHDTHNRQISMLPVGFEPTISAGERPQIYALDRAATGTGLNFSLRKYIFEVGWFGFPVEARYYCNTARNQCRWQTYGHFFLKMTDTLVSHNTDLLSWTTLYMNITLQLLTFWRSTPNPSHSLSNNYFLAFSLLGYYAACVGICLLTFRDSHLVLSLRFKRSRTERLFQNVGK